MGAGMAKLRPWRRILGASVGATTVAAAVMVVSMASANAASTVTLSRAPYVTDLTQTSAYVNWAIEGKQTAGSVMVQPETGGSCPSSITWSSTNEITTPTTDPLVSGRKTTASWAVTVGTVKEWQASTPLSGLSPSTTYCYAIYPSHSTQSTQLWATQSFTTLDPAGSAAPLTFDVLGDTGETQSNTGVNYPGFLNPGEQAIYQEIGSSGARFLLMAGDVSYTGGTELSYGDLNQTGTDTSDIFGPQYLPQAKGIPTFVADGNHGQTSDDLRIWPEPQAVAASGGVYSYGAPPNAGVDGITNNSPSDWYAVQSGNVRIYVLDAAWGDTDVGRTTGAACTRFTPDCLQYQADNDEHWTTSSSEYKWLQADLAAHPGGVKMAVFHYPLQSANNTQPSDPYLSGLESLLAAGGVKVAFNGHAHTYQDIQPTAPNTVANFVTGGGGGILEPVDSNSDKSGECQALLASTSKVYALGWSPSSTTSPGSECSTGNVAPTPTSPMQVFNYLKVTVNGTQVTVTGINAQNQSFDSSTFSYGTVDTQKPTVPTGLAGAAVSTSQISLTWNASTDNVGVTGYDVYRNGTKIAQVTGTNFSDTGLQANTTYQYTVDAFDAAGNVSDQSAPVPVTTQSTGPPPPGPKLVQTAGSSTTSVSLSPTTTGNLLVLSASLYTGATNNITAVSDSAGDTWTKVKAADTAGHNSDGELWYAIAKAPSTSVSITTKASSEALEVQEFSGVAALDQSAFTSADTNTASSGSATPSVTGDLAIGFVAGHASNQLITVSAGFTAQTQVTTGTSATLATGYQVVGTGAQSFGGTFSNAMYWASGLALFTPSG